ncbi:MAG TPA: tRNA 4-thiouridine(8) synthase ThiI [Spirochaetota bacterium]|nr:tRNA 4-thiouridine(8) synthase ThiI [Spirochaetota bacterium]
MQKKGILLFSGGLDSLIAAQVLIEQGITVKAYNFLLPYEKPDYNPYQSAIAKSAHGLDMELNFVQCGDDYIKMLLDPPHGYGKNINPCIDCKILFLRKAKEIMINEDAAFIATGEVNGQRPMSQRKDMIIHIEKSAGLERMILRPLSARFFKPTLAEEAGIVNRDALLDINGRGRKIQMEMANKYGFTDYATPAGGCLLTEPHYSVRAKELFATNKSITSRDLYLLRLGRHFRIEGVKIVVARNADETNNLINLRNNNDTLFSTQFQGPSMLSPGNSKLSDSVKKTAAAIAARYGKPGKEDHEREVIVYERDGQETIIAGSIADEQINCFKI